MVASCSISPIISRYGELGSRKHPHRGVDFRADVGEPALAVADGFVAGYSYNEDAGWTVWVEHREVGLYSVYTHLQSVDVPKRYLVSRGEPIGQVGMFARSGKLPHVHLEICEYYCIERPPGLFATRDPLEYSDGCYSPKKSYAPVPFTLTWPVRCD